MSTPTPTQNGIAAPVGFGALHCVALLAAVQWTPYLWSMNTPKKDLDPSTELIEEDEEQSLPEPEQGSGIDLAALGGSLPAGRAAIARYSKLAPSSPGVYRMIDAQGDVLYVGKAKNIRKRIAAYGRPTGYDTRIERMIAATASLEFVSTATETEALLLEANLIKRLRPRFNVLLRDDKSFPFILITADHWAPQNLQASWRARAARPLLRAIRVRVGSESHHHRTCSARFCCALAPTLSSKAARGHACSTRSSAAPAHAPARSILPNTASLCARRTHSSGKSQAVKDQLAAEMDKASAALEFERAAIYRDRLAALSAVQSHQGINPRGVEDADVFAVHQASGFSCVEVFFFRAGQNWGNRAYFPKADRSLTAEEVLGAFLAQFYDDKPSPSCILISACD